MLSTFNKTRDTLNPKRSTRCIAGAQQVDTQPHVTCDRVYGLTNTKEITCGCHAHKLTRNKSALHVQNGALTHGKLTYVTST